MIFRRLTVSSDHNCFLQCARLRECRSFSSDQTRCELSRTTGLPGDLIAAENKSWEAFQYDKTSCKGSKDEGGEGEERRSAIVGEDGNA